MNKNIYGILALIITIYGTSLSMGPSKKQRDQNIVKNIIAEIRNAKDGKIAAAIKENAYNIIPALENLTEEEKVLALSEIDSLVPVVKKSQQEQKKEAGAMPAAPGDPRVEPKKVIKQKPMSEVRKEARRKADAMQRYAILSGAPTAEEVAEKRNKMDQAERNHVDKDLYDAATTIALSIKPALNLGANPNALIMTYKKISVPAFWGLIAGLQNDQVDFPKFHDRLITLHRYHANLDARASDGTPILNYLVKYWRNLENLDPQIRNMDGFAFTTLGRALGVLLHFGAELNAVDANGDTFLDILLRRIDDPFITGKAKEILEIIIAHLSYDSQKQELRDMIADYKREHVQPLREQMRRPAQQEVIQQPGVRNIMEEYLFGEKE